MAAVSSNQLTSGFTLNHRMHYPVLVYISGKKPLSSAEAYMKFLVRKK
jgi:hypothetical protein